MKRYIIIEDSPTIAQVNASLQDSPKKLRWNKTLTKCILKFSGPVPAEFKDYVLHTHEEILKEMAKAEWQVDLFDANPFG